MTLHSTLIDLLNSQLNSDLHVEFVQSQDVVTQLTPTDIKHQSQVLLAQLQRVGMAPGDELVIHTQSNEDFVIAFWAAVLGGLVPVPVAVGISDEHRNKLLRIVSQLKNPRVFSTQDIKDRLMAFASTHSATSLVNDASRWVTARDTSGDAGTCVEVNPGDLAFIQYSSGSTGNPKGVSLTHKNVTTNVRAIVEAAGWTSADRALSWMPLTHDMGLIGFHLSVLAAGMTHTIMDTSAFVRRPKLWLSLASDRKTTILCSPNFGYQHYLKAVERKGLDDINLSNVRQILNGAEPISRSLCDAFNQTLAPVGLRATAMRPVYGLAEATVGVSFSTPDTPYRSTRVARDHMAIGERLVTVDGAEDNAIELMHVGFPIRNVEMRLVNDQDQPVGPDTVGHLQLKGDSITTGIYRDADTSSELFTDDGWLRTGDSAALIAINQPDDTPGGELVIVGRIKDVLISSGQNFYAHDIENAVSSLSGAELGKVAVASVIPAGTDTEQVAVFVLFRQEPADFAPLANSLRAAISASTGLDAKYVVPVPRIPKTTSGKIQRHKLAVAFMDGEFNHVLEVEGVTAQPVATADSNTPADHAANDTTGVAAGATDANDVVSQLVTLAAGFVTEGTLGPDDNLFEVGVSSLTLTEIALAIEEQFPGKLDVSDLFDYPTLRDIATWVQRD